MKEQTAKEQQDSNLPAEYGTNETVLEHMRELSDSTPAMDPVIKMADRKLGIEVDEEEVAEILGMKVNAIHSYYGEWDSSSGEMVLLKYPLDEPQPEDTEERGELLVTWRGEDYIFSLAPSAWATFARFHTKWERRGFNVVNSTVHVRSKLVRTKSGHSLNVPRFCLVHPGNADPDTVEPVMVEDAVPWDD